VSDGFLLCVLTTFLPLSTFFPPQVPPPGPPPPPPHGHGFFFSLFRWTSGPFYLPPDVSFIAAIEFVPSQTILKGYPPNGLWFCSCAPAPLAVFCYPDFFPLPPLPRPGLCFRLPPSFLFFPTFMAIISFSFPASYCWIFFRCRPLEFEAPDKIPSIKTVFPFLAGAVRGLFLLILPLFFGEKEGLIVSSAVWTFWSLP